MSSERATLTFQRGDTFLLVPGFRQAETLAVARLIGTPQAVVAGAMRCTLSAPAVWGALTQGLTVEELLARVAAVTPDGVPSTVQAWVADTAQRASALCVTQDVSGWCITARDPAVLRRAGLTLTEDGRSTLLASNDDLSTARVALARAGYPLHLPRSAPSVATWRSQPPDPALRPYQRDAVATLQRAGSGVVQLPCGAGKTRIGVALVGAHVGPVLILTPSRDIGAQWVQALAIAGERRTVSMTSVDAPIVVATYSGAARGRIASELPSRQWGLVIFDEVHMLPATTFRSAAAMQADMRVGLTATLVREDGREVDIAALVGPPVYARTWRELEAEGWIAPATCVEVRLPYAPEPATRERYKRAVLRRLLQRHRAESVLVASSDLDLLKGAAQALGFRAVTGASSAAERSTAFAALDDGATRVLGMSRIGSVGIDIPRASVLVQLHGTFGSRQEEAQRLGRLLRPLDGKHAHFYSLVSEGTREVPDARRRQRFLVEQGYEYTIVQARDIERGDAASTAELR